MAPWVWYLLLMEKYVRLEVPDGHLLGAGAVLIVSSVVLNAMFGSRL